MNTPSEIFVATVAEGLRARLLAATKVCRGRFGGFVGHGFEACALVRTIAKRLLLGKPTGTPKVSLTRYDIDLIRLLLRDGRYRKL
jgi:hypothetical protein